MMLVSHRIFPPPHHQSQERISQTQRGYSRIRELVVWGAGTITPQHPSPQKTT